MSTIIRGKNNFCIYIRGTSLCIAGTVVRYLVVSIVGLFWGRKQNWLVLSVKGIMVCCIDGWVWFLFLWSSIIGTILRKD